LNIHQIWSSVSFYRREGGGGIRNLEVSKGGEGKKEMEKRERERKREGGRIM
jgi:hypothetical protein